MELQVGVKVLLRNEEGKYLLIRRNPKKYPETGPTWDIVGGRINPGESLLENLKREVREETGLEITDTPVIIGSQDIMGIARFPDRHVVRLSYTASATGTPAIDEESLEFKWFTKEEIEMLSEGEVDRFFLELLKNKLVFTS